MLDSRESPSAKLLEPNIQSSIETAAAELEGLVRIVRLIHNLDDETLDKLAWQGDVLLNRIAEYRAVSLDDVLLKLGLWRRLPADLWDSTRVIESVTVDLAELRRRDGAPGASPGITAHGGATLVRFALGIACWFIAWRARVRQRRARAILDDHMLNDTGLSRMDVIPACQRSDSARDAPVRPPSMQALPVGTSVRRTRSVDGSNNRTAVTRGLAPRPSG